MTPIVTVILGLVFWGLAIVLAFRETIRRIDRLDDRINALETRRREEDINVGRIIHEEMRAYAERRRRQAEE